MGYADEPVRRLERTSSVDARQRSFTLFPEPPEENGARVEHVEWRAQPFRTEAPEAKNQFEEWLVGDEKADRMIALQKGLSWVCMRCLSGSRFLRWAEAHRVIAFILFSLAAYALAGTVVSVVLSFAIDVAFMPGAIGAFFTDSYSKLQLAAILAVPPLVGLDTIRYVLSWSKVRDAEPF